jgi:hypothetical protein
VQDDYVPDGPNFIKLAPTYKVSRDSDMYSISMARGYSSICANGTVFTLFSNKGMKWISDKIDDHTLGDRLANSFMKMCGVQHEKMRPLVEPMNKPLPIDKTLVEACVEAFDRGPSFWRLIISREELNQIVQAEFYDSSLPPNGYAELLVLNAVVTQVVPLMLKERESLERMNLTDGQLFEQQDTYWVNSFFYARRTMLLTPNLTTLKGLCLLMLSLQCSNTPHPLGYVIRTAVYLAYEMGLNRKESCHGLSTEEANRRRCIWWLIFIIDHDVAMKIGRCPSIMEFDITTELPEFPPDDPRATDVKFSNQMVSLFKISASCYRKLFSAKAGTKQPAEIVRDVLVCDEELEKWKESIPAEYRPGCNLDYFQVPRANILKQDSMQKLGILYLHFLYYQLCSNIHRVVAYHPSWIYSFLDQERSVKSQDDSPNSTISGSSTSVAIHHRYPRLFGSLDICSHAARRCIEMIQRTKESNQVFLWGSLYFATNSFIILFIKCIAKPQDASTRFDLDLMTTLSNAFADVEVYPMADKKAIGYVTEFWRNLYGVAFSFVEKAQSSHPPTNDASPASVTNSFNGSHEPRLDNTRRTNLPQTNGFVPTPVLQEGFVTPLHRSNGRPTTYYVVDPSPSDTVTPDIAGNGVSQYMSGETCDYLPDPSMVQSLFQMSSYPFSWDSDLAVMSGLNESM